MCFGHLPLPFQEEFNYRQLSIKDHEDEDIRAHFESSYNFIEEAIANKEKILVHCYAGISRSTTILAAYLIRKHKKPLNEVLDMIKEKRNTVRPNAGFLRQLVEYERVQLAVNELEPAEAPIIQAEVPFSNPVDLKEGNPDPWPIPKEEADEGIVDNKVNNDQPPAP